MKTSLPFALLLGLLLTGATPLRAQDSPELLWSYPGVENVVSVAWIEDMDGDGGPDVIFESYDAGAPATDHIFCIRGMSSGVGTVIWSARPLGGPSNSGGYGNNCLRISPDLTGDGRHDVLLGGAWGSRTAFALSGTSGETVWSYDTYVQSPPSPPESGWIYAMDSLGQDIDGDGIPEVVFCTGSYNDGVYCVSGADGSILWFYQHQDALFDVKSIDDLNGDGVRDVIAGAGDNAPGVLALSGAGVGNLQTTSLWFRSCGSVFSVTRLEDISGDGLPEVVAAAWDNLIRCFSGANGNQLWAGTVGDYSMRAVTLDDVNNDGIEDVAIGSWDNAGRVYSGADGSLIWRTPVGTLNGGDCWAIDRVGDVTGDGINDVCCGSFDTKVYLMDGVDGTIQWAYTTGNRVYTVRGVPDISGNGVPDVVAGTQKLTTGGICYALEGGEDLSAAPDIPHAAGGIRLLPCAPNPFHDRTSWELQVGRAGQVEVLLYNAQGRRVAQLLPRDQLGAASYRLPWDGRDLHGRPAASGVYYARVLLDGRAVEESRAILIR